MPPAIRFRRISDPVHGYVEFTDIEREILDQPVAQRLRYVSQAGLAHLVFPEVRTARFSHSLGAMHLASRFLTACLKNSDEAARDKLTDAMQQAVRRVVGAAGNPAALSQSLATGVLQAHHYCRPDHRPHVLLAEQSLRLAALFHDIGHLPFSHDFEYAVGELWARTRGPAREQPDIRSLAEQKSGRTQLHERLGYSVAQLLLQELTSTVGLAAGGASVSAVFNLAFAILTAVPAPDPAADEAAVQWLHGLMSGDLDVDRCDYLLRDGRNYGFEFATYNLPRLLDNLVVAVQDQSFVLAVRPHGISPLESFLLARFRSYQYGVRHHKVAQVGAALQQCIANLLEERGNPAVGPFLQTLAKIVTVDEVDEATRRQLLASFAGYDDVWWTGVMRAHLLAHPEDEWLALVCWRKRGPKSLWKRPSDFASWLEQWQASRSEGSKLLPPEAGEPSVQSLVGRWNGKLPDPDDSDAQKQWEQVVGHLKEDGVLAVRHRFNPWEADPDTGETVLNVRTDDGTLIPVSRLSPLVRELRDAWKDDVQVHAFATSRSALEQMDVLNRLAPVMEGGR